MKANIIPLIVHPEQSILKQELKEQSFINNLAKKEIKKESKAKVESAKDFFVYITRTNIYFVRYKNKQKKKK